MRNKGSGRRFPVRDRHHLVATTGDTDHAAVEPVVPDRGDRDRLHPTGIAGLIRLASDMDRGVEVILRTQPVGLPDTRLRLIPPLRWVIVEIREDILRASSRRSDEPVNRLYHGAAPL